jgi:hypothetical protein
MAGTIFQDTHQPLTMWFRAIWYVTSQKNGGRALGMQRVLGLKSYQTIFFDAIKAPKSIPHPQSEIPLVSRRTRKLSSANVPTVSARLGTSLQTFDSLDSVHHWLNRTPILAPAAPILALTQRVAPSHA